MIKESDWTILDALYRELNITKAAEVLFMTQSGLTKRLKQIEQDFKTTVAIRHAKGIILTPQGEYLAKMAQQKLSELNKIHRQVLEMNDGNTGTLKLGVTNSFGRFKLPGILNRYKTVHPGIDFNIVSGLSGDVVRMVRDIELHIGFIRGDHDFEGIKHLISLEQGYVVYKEEIRFEDLPQIPRIEYNLDPLTVKLLDKWWYEHFTVAPLKGMTVNHGDTCREMIANGLGYGLFLVPEFIAGFDGLSKMVMRKKDNKPLTRNTWMISNNDAYSIPLVKKFFDFVKN